MKKKAHSESEMEKTVKDLESGVPADSVAREHGISKGTLYNWKGKYSGMSVSQVRRLKELEEENRRLKQMHADLALDNRIWKDMIENYNAERPHISFRKYDTTRIYCHATVTFAKPLTGTPASLYVHNKNHSKEKK